MLSKRAETYLHTLERVPSLTDEKRIREIFDKSEVPVFDVVIEFQIRFGGYVEFYGFNKFIWGILHEVPEEDSFLEPNTLDFYVEDEEYYFTCANCHRSDSWSLDTKGILYWCGYKKALSFEKKIERDAATTEIFNGKEFRKVKFELSDNEIIETITPKIESGLIEEASDKDQKLYFQDNFYFAVDCEEKVAKAYLVGKNIPDWLKSAPLTIL